jgi:hypothetical protein
VSHSFSCEKNYDGSSSPEDSGRRAGLDTAKVRPLAPFGSVAGT